MSRSPLENLYAGAPTAITSIFHHLGPKKFPTMTRTLRIASYRSPKSGFCRLLQRIYVVKRRFFLPAMIQTHRDLALELVVERNYVRRLPLEKLEHVQTETRFDDAGKIAFVLQRIRRCDEFVGPLVRPKVSDVTAAST